MEKITELPYSPQLTKDIRAAGIANQQNGGKLSECLYYQNIHLNKKHQFWTLEKFKPKRPNLCSDLVFTEEYYNKLDCSSNYLIKNNLFYPQSSIKQEKIGEMREQRFNRNEYKPLGKVVRIKGINLPEIVDSPDFKFGIATLDDGMSVKQCIETHTQNDDLDEKVSALYRISHKKHRLGEPVHYGFSLKEIKRIKEIERINEVNNNRQQSWGYRVKDSVEKTGLKKKILSDNISEKMKDRNLFSLGKSEKHNFFVKLRPRQTYGTTHAHDKVHLSEIFQYDGEKKQNPKSINLEIIHLKNSVNCHEPLTAKITDSKFGGEKLYKKKYLMNERFRQLEQNPNFSYGVDSVKSVSPEQFEALRPLGDCSNYGNQLRGKALFAPTAVDIHGPQFTEFKKQFEKNGGNVIPLNIPSYPTGKDALGKHIVKVSPIGMTQKEVFQRNMRKPLSAI